MTSLPFRDARDALRPVSARLHQRRLLRAVDVADRHGVAVRDQVRRDRAADVSEPDEADVHASPFASRFLLGGLYACQAALTGARFENASAPSAVASTTTMSPSW